MTINIVHPPKRRYTSPGGEVVKVKRIVVAAAVLLVASLAQATYVVLLRNGERVVARDKYVVKGPNAILTLKNGTLTAIPLAAIDVPKTDALNARHLGDAVPLDWVDQQEVAPTPTPTPTPSVATLGHLRSDLAAPVGDAALPQPTPVVFLRDAHYHDQQVEETFSEGLERYHLYQYRMSVGSQPSYLFVQVQVNGQNDVVKALQAITTTYHVLVETASERAPERVEVQMLNESSREAGVFRISPADAADLATAKITPEEFFVKHVIF
jgi:hypothetical protein